MLMKARSFVRIKYNFEGFRLSDYISRSRYRLREMLSLKLFPVKTELSKRELKADMVILTKPIAYACETGCVECCRRFAYIPVSKDEARWLTERGASVWKEKGEWRFLIKGGCRFIENEKCAIYDEPLRPEICKKIICYYMINKLGISSDMIDEAS